MAAGGRHVFVVQALGALLLCVDSSGALASWRWELDTHDAATLDPARHAAASTPAKGGPI